MFARTLFTVLMLALSASQWPTIAAKIETMLAEREAGAPEEVAAKPGAASSGQTVLSMGPGGHYEGTFKMNGKPVKAMVDTGASLVAINVSTARRLGFSPRRLISVTTLVRPMARSRPPMSCLTVSRSETSG